MPDELRRATRQEIIPSLTYSLRYDQSPRQADASPQRDDGSVHGRGAGRHAGGVEPGAIDEAAS